MVEEEDFFKLGVEVALQLAFPPWMRHEMEGGRQEQPKGTQRVLGDASEKA